MKQAPLCLLIPLLVLFLQCGVQTAGSGTETTNGGISGKIDSTTISNYDAAALTVSLFSADYRPDIALGFAESLLTIDKSTFTFAPLSFNEYNLIIWYNSGTVQLGAFIPNLPADTVLGTVNLTSTGSLLARYTHTTSTVLPPSYRIIIPGTPFYQVGKPYEDVSIPRIPRGSYVITLQRWFDYDIVGIPGISDTTFYHSIFPEAGGATVLEIF